MNIATVLDHAKNLAAAAGVGGVLWSAYSVSGLPVPATIAQVDQRIASVSTRLDGLKLDSLEGRRAVITLSKGFLRNERAATLRTIEAADPAARVSLSRRVAEIDDGLKDLEADDAELRASINKLRR